MHFKWCLRRPFTFDSPKNVSDSSAIANWIKLNLFLSSIHQLCNQRWISLIIIIFVRRIICQRHHHLCMSIVTVIIIMIIRWSSLHMKASWQPFSSPLQVYHYRDLIREILIDAWHFSSEKRIDDKFNQLKEKQEKSVNINFRSQNCDCQWERDSYQVEYLPNIDHCPSPWWSYIGDCKLYCIDHR